MDISNYLAVHLLTLSYQKDHMTLEKVKCYLGSTPDLRKLSSIEQPLSRCAWSNHLLMHFTAVPKSVASCFSMKTWFDVEITFSSRRLGKRYLLIINTYRLLINMQPANAKDCLDDVSKRWSVFPVCIGQRPELSLV